MGKLATSSLPFGDPHRFRAGGGESKVAHLWARWIRNPCRLGDSHHFKAGGKHEEIENTKKAKAKLLQAAGFEPRTSEISAYGYYQLSYARIC